MITDNEKSNIKRNISTTNSTWTALELKFDLPSEKTATNHLSFGMALYAFLLRNFIFLIMSSLLFLF